MAGYLQELSEVRAMLDGRYDDLNSGRVKPVDGEEAFAKLRQKSKERRGEATQEYTTADWKSQNLLRSLRKTEHAR